MGRKNGTSSNKNNNHSSRSRQHHNKVTTEHNNCSNDSSSKQTFRVMNESSVTKCTRSSSDQTAMCATEKRKSLESEGGEHVRNGDGESSKCTEVSENDGDSVYPTKEFYPFAYALYNQYLDDHCWYCLLVPKSSSLRRCSGCSKAMFCDEKCQKLAWKDHRAECKALKSCHEIPNIEIRLLGRIITRYKAIKNGFDKKDETFYLHRTSERSIMDIWAHTDRIRNDSLAMNKFNDVYKKLVTFYGTRALLTKEEAFELHCRDYINRHAISDVAYLEEIGKGLYLDLCAYDHSCRPNTVYTCNGFVATLRALNSDVQLTNRSATFYSYIDVINCRQERRKLLKDTWYFDCECARCVDNEDNMLTSMLCPECSEKLGIFGEWPYKNPVTQIITCPKCTTEIAKEKVVEAIDAMQFINRILQSNQTDQMRNDQAIRFLTSVKDRFSRILPNLNVFVCKIIQMLIPLIDPRDNETLLKLHLQSEECVRFCFPDNHPALAVHLSNIGVFYLRCGHPHRAELYLEMAHDILSSTLGKGHPMTLTKYQLLQDARHEVEQAKQIIMRSSKCSEKSTECVGENKRNNVTQKRSNMDTEKNMDTTENGESGEEFIVAVGNKPQK